MAKGSFGFQLGGEALVAGGPVGRDARASTDAQVRAEILSYSRARGLFAGLDLSGGMLRADNDANRAYYGEDLKARDILTGADADMTMPDSARTFVSTLAETAQASSKR